MLEPILVLLWVACMMIAAHELGHVVVTRILGGRWLGVEHQGWMVGVRLSVRSLSNRQIAVTLLAGPSAEIFVVAMASIIAPQYFHWWVLLLLVQWIGNVIPWGIIPNDGTRLWQLWRHRTIESSS
ncbi:MAG: hypothetical protein C7B45_01265 [Sulfobacillus acidophilus]|uniref:Peptidase M50 domain-containing protein n=1 Tax=Sulfobacillus acidophilus TaxID=53633 RepID=A0A2T2WNZ2_9FIRM|nr:MAG: hypothetical protein C7B45_01265 [Sulfobacillus acidophilus]